MTAPTLPADAMSGSPRAPRALIVDDNALNLEMAAVLLRADGWVVHSALDAPTARVQWDEAAPDVVLMDIQLPDIDGLQATRALKADPATRDVPVIAFTAYAMKGDRQRLLEAGCDGYIAKPIDVASFASEVRRIVAAHAAARAARPAT